MPSPMDLSVVVPAYNEAGRLRPTLDRILGYLEDRGDRFEVLVVDDGSTDRTASVAGEFTSRGVWVLELARNRGKGAALRHGVVASRGRRVLLTDADLSTPIEELERLESFLDEAEIVLGSRATSDASVEVHQPWYRELMGKTFNVIIRAMGLVRFRDTQCGFKLLDGEVARSIFPELRIDGFAYDVELVRRAESRGCRVVEVGVVWRDEPTSRVRPVRHALQMLRDVVRIRLGI